MLQGGWKGAEPIEEAAGPAAAQAAATSAQQLHADTTGGAYSDCRGKDVSLISLHCFRPCMGRQGHGKKVVCHVPGGASSSTPMEAEWLANLVTGCVSMLITVHQVLSYSAS